MDPEQTFLRVHARVSGMLSQLLTPRIRLALEYGYLAVAVALFCLLAVMHVNFVQQPGCSSEFSGVEFTEAQLVQIKIISGGLWGQSAADRNIVEFQKQDTLTENSKIPEVNGDEFTILTAKFWSNWLGSGARRSKLIFRSWKSDKEFLEPQLDNAADSSISKAGSDETDIEASTEGHKGLPLSARESLKAAPFHFFTKWRMRFVSFWKNVKQFSQSTFQLLTAARWNESFDISKCLQVLHMEHLSSLIVQWLEKRSKAFEPTYLYAAEKGFFLLPEGAKSRHNIRMINISISSQNPCFGNRWQQLLINSLVGYDTILTNSLLSSPGQGYLYNFQTKELYGLSYGHDLAEGPARFGDYFVTKCGVLIMSLFVFFTTIMSVSFTLRETQSRMLKFTVQLQHHARHQLPTFQLIFVHVIESLVFVPIMIGILFFLFEFYDDQLLAFLVLTLVWLCELFTMISVRTWISRQFFPRFFLLYFLVFHIYFFSYAYGFSYLAFSVTAAFMQHLILYFWNRFEVPALQRVMRSRGQMQQQAGVQITSSTIYTSTVHIARVDVRNGGVVNNELGDGPRLHSVPDHPGSAESTETQEQLVVDRPDSISNTLHFQALGPRQTGTAPGSSLLNPFGSLLLWILGGASSDGIVPFFSMFRDVPDQGQVFAENSRHENETGT
ncbi:membralin-like protein At1g60995 [Phoenix dactylifera]|uniref:Membralin-like protein At1g60995 n=1 Tax=Phoenix dactylifera TaxID=42345 RepID=A0A8B7BXF0_PHODC|nr:membralin-like protein At1g60995 [Phoenix dactylifera]